MVGWTCQLPKVNLKNAAAGCSWSVIASFLFRWPRLAGGAASVVYQQANCPKSVERIQELWCEIKPHLPPKVNDSKTFWLLCLSFWIKMCFLRCCRQKENMKVFSLFPLFEDLVGRLETERIRKAEQKKRQRNRMFHWPACISTSQRSARQTKTKGRRGVRESKKGEVMEGSIQKEKGQ